MTRALAFSLFLAAGSAAASDCGIQAVEPSTAAFASRVWVSTGQNARALSEEGGPVLASPKESFTLAFVETPGSYAKPPWDTKVAVFRGGKDPRGTTVRFRGHGSTPVTATWLDERLVAFRAWWGLVALDLVLDAETGAVVSARHSDFRGVSSCGKP